MSTVIMQAECVTLALALSIACLGACSGQSADPHADPIMIWTDGQWGFFDAHAQEAVIAPKFGKATPFENGVAAVVRLGKVQIIDSRGHVLANLSYPDTYGFKEGYCTVFVDAGGGGRFEGLVNRDGETVVAPKYAAIRYGSSKYPLTVCESRDGGQIACGVMSWNGEMLTPLAFANMRKFTEGLAAAAIQDEAGRGVWGYVNMDGQWVIHPAYSWAWEFSEGVAAVAVPDARTASEEWWFVDNAGQKASPRGFLKAKSFSQGLAPVQEYVDRRRPGWGYIDRTWQAVVPVEFNNAEAFSEGLAAVQVWAEEPTGRLWGYIDRNGEWAIEPRFEVANEFHNGVARVSEGGQSGYVDRVGRWVWRSVEEPP